MGSRKKRMKLRQLFENVASAAIGRAVGRDAAKVAGKEAGIASKTVSKAKAVAQADSVDKKKNGMTVGVCFGRWNPPHKGHRAAWEIASQNNTFYVGTNKNTEGPNDPLPYDVKLNCMETIWPEIKGHVIPEQSLFTLASKVFAKHGEGAHLKVATDEDWLTSSLVKYNGIEGAHGYYKFASIEQVPTPRLSSATQLRAAVRAGDRDAFAEAAGVDANTPIRVGAKAIPFFDLVSYYLEKHPEKVKKIKEHKKGVRAMKYTKKPVNHSAQHAKAKEKLAPIKPGVEKQTDECAGVGIITKQNSTGDVNKGTPYKNLKAFNLVKEASSDLTADEMVAVLSGQKTQAQVLADRNKPATGGAIPMDQWTKRAKAMLARGMNEQQVIQQFIKDGLASRLAQQAVQAAQINEVFLQELESAMLQEAGMKKIEPSAKAAMKNAMTFPSMNQSTGSAYMNYRMGIAMAGAPDYPTKMEKDNWIGGDPLLSTYTEEEMAIVNAAAKAVGGGSAQNWSGNRSKEIAGTNVTSPVAKPKKNKYGV